MEAKFIDEMIEISKGLTVFLISGVKLFGVIDSQCDYCITLTRDGVTQLVYKSAIASIMPPDEKSYNK